MTKPKPKPPGISQEDWDAVDSPPVGKRMIMRMKPAKRGRGPQKAPTKEHISVRLDSDLVAHFRAIGPGWQTRLNALLRKAAGL
ncbi:MAG: BrnA antitoxin family protein [Alphaproteobacteria bacterium]|nr:BrnA antitoxin family protein [Alphaproteobacteria bacterium]